jgi:hypothetical protein
MDVLQVMGIMKHNQFKALSDLLVDVRIEKSPLQDTSSLGLLKQRYFLCFREYDPSREPLIEVFLAHVENILNAWISGARIEVEKEIVGVKPESSQRKGI